MIQGLDIFGNCYCTQHCNPREMIEREGPLHGFELDVREASGERVRTAFSLFVVRGGRPGAHIVVHLMRPVATESAGQREAGEGPQSGQAPRTPAALPTAGEALSPREIEVLQLVAAGASTQRIAQSLSLSIATVRTHVQNILRKLGAHSRLEAVAIARHNRLL